MKSVQCAKSIKLEVNKEQTTTHFLNIIKFTRNESCKDIYYRSVGKHSVSKLGLIN